MKIILPLTLTVFYFFGMLTSNAQTCRVIIAEIGSSYTGDCKDGLANGKGEAKGMHRYVGNFKMGYPHGNGTYYYGDSSYYTGNFQDGLKEGKGEMHYVRSGGDSVVKGYWSNDVFRGKQYTTYTASGINRFDRFEAEASKESGKTITIEITTTTGSPNGTSNTLSEGVQYLLTIKELFSTNGVDLKKVAEFNTAFKATEKYEVDKFPVKLTMQLSIGEPVFLELYKAANWTIRIYVNK